jgi:WD40 repeat protein
MRDIQCIEWKPLSGNTLAVGTRYGVCVWDIISKASQPAGVDDVLPIQSQDQTAWMRYWQYPNQAPVNALSWCPKGQYLATGSVSSGEVVIWDTASGAPTPLFEVLAAGIVQLCWSPNGDYLMAASAGGSVRVWEAYRWSSDKWVDFPSFAQSVAWYSDDSSTFLAVAVQSTLHLFRFESKETPSCQGVSVGSFDFSNYIGRTQSRKEVSLCGRIHQVVWDPTGSRIAVSFFDSPLIGVLSCRSDIVSKVVFDVQPLGFIQGPPQSGSPTQLEFRQNCSPEQGALLGVLWQSGRISFYPMYFKARLLRDQLNR